MKIVKKCYSISLFLLITLGAISSICVYELKGIPIYWKLLIILEVLGLVIGFYKLIYMINITLLAHIENKEREFHI